MTTATDPLSSVPNLPFLHIMGYCDADTVGRVACVARAFQDRLKTEEAIAHLRERSTREPLLPVNRILWARICEGTLHPERYGVQRPPPRQAPPSPEPTGEDTASHDSAWLATGAGSFLGVALYHICRLFGYRGNQENSSFCTRAAATGALTGGGAAILWNWTSDEPPPTPPPQPTVPSEPLATSLEGKTVSEPQLNFLLRKLLLERLKGLPAHLTHQLYCAATGALLTGDSVEVEGHYYTPQAWRTKRRQDGVADSTKALRGFPDCRPKLFLLAWQRNLLLSILAQLPQTDEFSAMQPTIEQCRSALQVDCEECAHDTFQRISAHGDHPSVMPFVEGVSEDPNDPNTPLNQELARIKAGKAVAFTTISSLYNADDDSSGGSSAGGS